MKYHLQKVGRSLSQRILFAGLVLFFFAPFAVEAQVSAEVAKGYCPDRSQVFTGIKYDANEKPRIELLVNPDFEQKFQKERHLGTLPVTPIYDLVVRVVPAINEYCLLRYNADGAFAVKVDPPGRLPFTVYFALGNEVLLGGTATHYATQKTESGEPYYEWEVRGWPNGILISEKMGKVIKAVQENDPTLRIGVLVDRSLNDVEKVEKPISFELCVPLAGGYAPKVHKVVNMRGKSAGLNIATLVRIAADGYRESGFEDIEPFKTFSQKGKSWFAHFVDLSIHDDTGWAMFFGQFFIGANSRPRKISACGNDASQYFFHTGRMKTETSYAPYGGGIAFMASRNGGVKPAYIAMHEMGHSFGWLEDEYHSGFDLTLYYANCAPASPIISETEISRIVGSNKILRNRIETGLRRAYWNPYGDTISGCHTKGQARPSVKSIMNSGDFGSGQFNVVSCGYLIRSITGEENLREHWKECMAMNGVEKPITTPSNIISLSSPLEKILSLFMSPASFSDGLFAAVAAPTVTNDTRAGIDPSRFINVETFLTGGEIQSEIFERLGEDKGEQTMWRKVETEKDSDEPTPTTEAVAKQYCPDRDKDFFKGSIYHTEDGKPWIEVKVDPEFEQEELRGKRKITGDIPLTPVYDLVVRIKPEFNYYCIPGWAGGGAEVTAEKLPQSVPIDGFLTVGAKDEAVAGPGVFERTEKKDEQKRFIYEWKLKGWKSGIAPVEKMERLIKAIGEKEPVHVRLEVAKSGGTVEKEKSPVSFNLCAPIWGSGEHEIVTMRGTRSRLSVSEEVRKADIDTREKGFEKIEPLKTYKDHFTHLVDLRQYDGDAKLLNKLASRSIIPLKIGELSDYKDLPQKSSCSNIKGKGYLLYVGSTFPVGQLSRGGGVEGIAAPGSPVVVMHDNMPSYNIIHELAGHTIGGLSDEYLLGGATYLLDTSRNCALKPEGNYVFGGKLYGATNIQGCSVNFLAKRPEKAGSPPQLAGKVYRPSPKGLMNMQFWAPEFSIVNCGYIIAGILGGDAKSYFPECAKMDGIIKDGVTAQNIFSPIFAWIENWQKGSSAAGEELAAVAAGFGR